MLRAYARNDVMLAHYAVGRNTIHEVNIIAKGNIICPKGQASFIVFSFKDNTLISHGWPLLRYLCEKIKPFSSCSCSYATS